jgi:hypothetical protein
MIASWWEERSRSTEVWKVMDPAVENDTDATAQIGGRP